MAEVLAGRSDVRTAVEALMLRRQRARGGNRLGFAWMGVLGRIRESLSRTKQQIVERFDEIVRRADAPERRSRPIDVDTIEALEELLITADVGVAATERIVRAVRQRSPHGASLRDLVKQEIRAIFAAVEQPVIVEHLAAGHADRRRQRHRQDDDGRQAGEPAEEPRASGR